MISQTKDKVVKSTNEAWKATQKYVKENKEELLNVAEGLQTHGDNLAITGLVAPGLATAFVGELVGGVGVVMEIAVNGIAEDGSGVKDTLGIEASSQITGAIVDQLIPGPNPRSGKVIKELMKANKEIVKTLASEKAEATASEIVNMKN